jgi:sugar phosphate isomerase/epimerase
MKLSCLPVSLYPDLAAGRLTPGGWLRMAADLGLDGADLSVAHIPSRTAGPLAELRHAAENVGIPIVMLATYSDFTHPDPAERTRQIEDIRRWIAAAQALGVTFLRLTAGQAHPDVPEESGLAWATEGLLACLNDAAAAGVQLLYENHVRGAIWSANDFTQPAARFLEVARRTAGSPLEILFDTANCLALNDDPVAVLQQILPRVGAVHLSDIKRPGAFEPTVLGTGATPLPALLGMLKAYGFDGWMSIEEASRTGEAGFRSAITYARGAWEQADTETG